MYRTSSSSRVFDELLSGTVKTPDSDLEQQQQKQQIPRNDSESELSKKDKNRVRSAEAAVHFIPLLLILCAAVLWFCSEPDSYSEVLSVENGVGAVVKKSPEKLDGVRKTTVHKSQQSARNCSVQGSNSELQSTFKKEFRPKAVIHKNDTEENERMLWRIRFSESRSGVYRRRLWLCVGVGRTSNLVEESGGKVHRIGYWVWSGIGSWKLELAYLGNGEIRDGTLYEVERKSECGNDAGRKSGDMELNALGIFEVQATRKRSWDS
ncbi:transducin/WD40 repeat-like superfamily protein [Striga asiatica]|uniref:Transducin/WD40 repeat-like superfamily protein n=1 Tax=Striga asiatica TaxID=4170 RepID=A0A5A7NZN3_STRAF|nr:transducin/WD40 repeat-like superfamily protein [Striga asiatica]